MATVNRVLFLVILREVIPMAIANWILFLVFLREAIIVASVNRALLVTVMLAADRVIIVRLVKITVIRTPPVYRWEVRNSIVWYV